MALIVNIARASDTTDPSFFRNKGRLIDRAVEEMFIYEASKPEYQRWIDTQIDRFKENKEVLQAFFPSFALQLYKDKKQHRFKLNDIPPQIPEKLYPYFYNIVEDVFKIKIPKRGGSGIEDLIKQVMLNWCPIVEKMGSISQTPREYIFTNKIFFEYLVACGLREEFLDIVKEQGRKPGGRLNEFLHDYVNKKEHEDVIQVLVGLVIDCEVELGKINCLYQGEGSFLCHKDSTCYVEERKQKLYQGA